MPTIAAAALASFAQSLLEAGGASAEEKLGPWLQAAFGIRSGHLSDFLALAIIVIPLSAITIIAGELIPKVLAMKNAEFFCTVLSPAMWIFTLVVYPAVWILEGVTKGFVTLVESIFPSRADDHQTGLHELRAQVNLLRASQVIGMQEERIIYREDNVDRIDFPALGEAVSGIKLGTVDFKKLQDPLSSTRFLTNLLGDELGPQRPEPDAIIITGPKLMLDKKVPQDSLKEAGRANCPIFYLNYNFNPRTNPWRDAIGSALKVYKGLEYTISLPRDLGAAMTDMMFRMSSKR